MKYLYFFITTLFVLHNCFAQTIITDRPDQTESSSVVPNGSIQIETGLLITDNYPNSENSLYLPSTLFRLGLTNTIELRVLNQFEYKLYDTYSMSGFNNIECGLKIQLLQKKEMKTELAFLSHMVLNTASELFNENKLSLINKLCVSHQSNSNISFAYNIGYNHHKDQTGDFTYSLVCGYEISDKVNTYIEPYGEIIEFNEHVSNINMGITYLLQKHIQLDYSFGTGLNNTFNFMSIGCSIRIL